MRRHLLILFFTQIFYLNIVYGANPIVVISIDGLRPDAIAKAKATNLMKLINGGTSFSRARTVRPSVTLPAHTSMLTGLDPAQHGIVWDVYLPTYGPVRHKTALEIAKEAGFHTALFVAKEKLLHLNRPNSVDHFEKTDKEGNAIADAFADYVGQRGLPDVSFLHLPDPDASGHLYLWMSRLYLSAVRSADHAVGRIVETARRAPGDQKPTIIVTADHGGHGFNHIDDIKENNQVPFIVNGDKIAAGIIRDDLVQTSDVAPTILSILGLAIPDHWTSRPVPVTSQPKSKLLPTNMQ